MEFEIVKEKTVFKFKVDEEKLNEDGQLMIRYQMNGKVNELSEDGYFLARRIRPEHSAIEFWTRIRLGKKTVNGIIIPEEIMDRLVKLEETLKEKAKQEKENQKRRILEGKEKIKASYHDGEYLSGYMVFGLAAELLEELGLAKYINGWGTHIKTEFIEKYGEVFTYLDAVEFMKPIIEERKNNEKQKQAEIDEKFKEAKQTGKPVLLYMYSDDCNDPNEDCDLDNIAVYAMPDGSTKEVRHHTW